MLVLRRFMNTPPSRIQRVIGSVRTARANTHTHAHTFTQGRKERTVPCHVAGCFNSRGKKRERENGRRVVPPKRIFLINKRLSRGNIKGDRERGHPGVSWPRRERTRNRTSYTKKNAHWLQALAGRGDDEGGLAMSGGRGVLLPQLTWNAAVTTIAAVAVTAVVTAAAASLPLEEQIVLSFVLFLARSLFSTATFLGVLENDNGYQKCSSCRFFFAASRRHAGASTHAAMANRCAPIVGACRLVIAVDLRHRSIERRSFS